VKVFDNGAVSPGECVLGAFVEAFVVVLDDLAVFALHHLLPQELVVCYLLKVLVDTSKLCDVPDIHLKDDDDPEFVGDCVSVKRNGARRRRKRAD